MEDVITLTFNSIEKHSISDDECVLKSDQKQAQDTTSSNMMSKLGGDNLRSRRATSSSNSTYAEDIDINDADESDVEDPFDVSVSTIHEEQDQVSDLSDCDLAMTSFEDLQRCNGGGVKAHRLSQLFQELNFIKEKVAASLIFSKLPHDDDEEEEGKTDRHVLNGTFGNLFHCLFGSTKKPISSRGNKNNKDDHFEIEFEDIQQLKWIGSGAHGCVFLGEYKHQQVAVKKFRDASLISTEEQTLKGLKHENIVGLKGVCRKAPCFCLVMEYCPKSLYDVIQTTKIRAPLALEWAKQVAHGMQYLHENGVIHRDLKSPNVLVAQDKRTLKISDFGTSTDVPVKSTKMSFKGTVGWMSPELLRGEASSEKVDVYSFGVVLWELLSGEIPYFGVDAGAVIWGVGSGRLHLPIPEGTPDGFALLMRQCWNSQSKHRPSFRQIQLHLSILQNDTEFAIIPDDSYFQTQLRWKREIKERFEEMKKAEDDVRQQNEDLIEQREAELEHIRDIRHLFETRLSQVTGLHAELKTTLARVQRQEELLNQTITQFNVDDDQGHLNKNDNRKANRRRHRSKSNSTSQTRALRGVKPRRKSRDSLYLKTQQDVLRLQQELEQSLEDAKKLKHLESLEAAC